MCLSRHSSALRTSTERMLNWSVYNPQQKNKKEPEFSHFCDTCDRGFKNQEKYDEHVSQHVKVILFLECILLYFVSLV